MNPISGPLPFVSEWTTAFSRISWQASLVAGVVLVAVAALPRVRASFRFALLLLALVKFALPPLLSAPTGVFSQLTTIDADPPRALPPVAAPAFREGSRAPELAELTPAFSRQARANDPPAARSATTTTSLDLATIFVVAQVTGAALLLAWLVRSRIRVRTIVANATPPGKNLAARARAAFARVGARRPITIHLSNLEIAPFAAGMFSRRVVLPRGFASLPTDEQDAILAHEAAHHARGDLVVDAFVSTLALVHWMNPVFWLLVSKLRRTREECCDDRVLSSAVASPATYANALLNAASRTWAAASVGMLAEMAGHPVRHRLLRVLDPSVVRRRGFTRGDVALLAVIGGLVLPGLRAATETSDTAAKIAAPPALQGAASREVVGRVRDDGGTPVAGARILLSSHYDFQSPIRDDALRAISLEDGTFRFRALSNDLLGDSNPKIIAWREGYSIAVSEPPIDVGTNVDLILARNEVPLLGRVLDIAGRPIAGARVRVRKLHTGSSEAISRFATLLAAGDLPPSAPEWMILTPVDWPLATPVAISDSDGRVEVRGFGENALLQLAVDGDESVPALVTVFPRLRSARLHPRDPAPGVGSTLYQTAEFTVAVEACRVVEGVVRDRATGAPLHGVRVRFERFSANSDAQYSLRDALDGVEATTDANGEYRLIGLPARNDLLLVAFPLDASTGHTRQQLSLAKAASTPGASKAAEESRAFRLDFDLDRLAVAQGRVRDAETGAPISGCQIRYWFDNHNAEADRHPDFNPFAFDSEISAADGSFAIAVLPGRGRVVVMATPEYRTFGESAETTGNADDPSAAFIGEIAPDAVGSVVRLDVELRRGLECSCRIVDENGIPVAGCEVIGAVRGSTWSAPLPDANVTLVAYDPAHPRVVYARHEALGLAGALDPDPTANHQVLVLAKTAHVAARLVDGDGQPRSAVWIQVHGQPIDSAMAGDIGGLSGMAFSRSVVTDADGRFEIRQLMPGIVYHARERKRNHGQPASVVFTSFDVTGGARYDVGDVQSSDFQ